MSRNEPKGSVGDTRSATGGGDCADRLPSSAIVAEQALPREEEGGVERMHGPTALEARTEERMKLCIAKDVWGHLGALTTASSGVNGARLDERDTRGVALATRDAARTTWPAPTWTSPLRLPPFEQ